MAYKINPDKCEACSGCADACPMGIITQDDETGKYVIDADSCVSCGACAGQCEYEAIEEE